MSRRRLTAVRSKPNLMPMHVSTLEILEKRFPPDDARAIAQAIEEETNPPKLVTNESLKLQLSEIKLQLSELETRLFTKIVALGLPAAGLIVSAVFFLVLNIRK